MGWTDGVEVHFHAEVGGDGLARMQVEGVVGEVGGSVVDGGEGVADALGAPLLLCVAAQLVVGSGQLRGESLVSDFVEAVAGVAGAEMVFLGAAVDAVVAEKAVTVEEIVCSSTRFWGPATECRIAAPSSFCWCKSSINETLGYFADGNNVEEGFRVAVDYV